VLRPTVDQSNPNLPRLILTVSDKSILCSSQVDKLAHHDSQVDKLAHHDIPSPIPTSTAKERPVLGERGEAEEGVAIINTCTPLMMNPASSELDLAKPINLEGLSRALDMHHQSAGSIKFIIEDNNAVSTPLPLPQLTAASSSPTCSEYGTPCGSSFTNQIQEQQRTVAHLRNELTISVDDSSMRSEPTPGGSTVANIASPLHSLHNSTALTPAAVHFDFDIDDATATSPFVPANLDSDNPMQSFKKKGKFAKLGF
jgi:hypothetical protein